MRRLVGISMLLFTGAGVVGSLSTTSCGNPTEVHSVYMALDGTGDRRRTHFYTDTETMFCDVDFVGDRKDLTVNAILRLVTSEACPAAFYPVPSACPGGNALQSSWNQGLKETNTVISVIEQAPGTGANTLAFSWALQAQQSDAGSQSGSNSQPPPPWPVGKYRCEIYVDGVLQGQSDFDVRYPDGSGQAYTGKFGNQGACPVSPVLPQATCWDYVVPGAQCLNSIGSVCTCDQTAGVWKCQ
jgi:hypothetical protein